MAETSQHTVTLTLTEEEWQELESAVGTKIANIENGSYSAVDDGLSLVDWRRTLLSLKEKLTTAMDENDIFY